MIVTQATSVQESKERITKTLTQYKGSINQLFSICMDVVKFARAMNAMVSAMQILAMNGVVLAAKVQEGQGKPLLALGEILSDLPEKISPEVRELESWCIQVAKNTARCSDLVRRYYQHTLCLVTSVFANVTEENAEVLEELARVNLTKTSGISNFTKHPFFDALEPLSQMNLRRIGSQCELNLDETLGLLKHSMQCLEKAKQASENIKTVGTTARYLCLYISVEASYLSQNQKSFENLATTIHETINRLDTQFEELKDTIVEGDLVLKRLVGKGGT